MNKLVLFITTCLVSLIANAQENQFKWVKGIGGIAHQSVASVVVDSDGNVYSAGYFSETTNVVPGNTTFSMTAKGGYDIFITKNDSSGNFIWAKHIGGIDDEFVTSLDIDQDNNIYLAGKFKSTVDFDPGTGEFNLTADNDDTEVFLCKLNTSGEFIFANQFAVGFIGIGPSVAISGENIYVAGSFSETCDFDSGTGTFNLTAENQDGFYLKMNLSGDFIWVKQLKGNQDEVVYSIIADASGNLYSIGTFGTTADFDPGNGVYTLSQTNQNCGYILKLDADGNFVWAKSFGLNTQVSVTAITLDRFGNIYVTGSFYGGTVDFDFGPGLYQVTPDLNLGGTYILKITANSDFIWVRQLGGENTGMIAITSIATDEIENVYTCGLFRGTIDIDPGVDTYSMNIDNPPFKHAGFISKLNASGNFEWAVAVKGLSNNSSVWANSIVLESTHIYVGGSYTEHTDFDPSVDLHELNSIGAMDGFILNLKKLPVDISGIKDLSTENYLIYPNPTKGLIHLEIDTPFEVDLKIQNAVGSEVYSISGFKNQVDIDLSDLSNGFYFVNIIYQDKVIGMKKIIKE